MKSRSVRFASVTLTVHYCEELEDSISLLLDFFAPGDARHTSATIEIRQDENTEQLALASPDLNSPVVLIKSLMLEQVANTITRLFASHIVHGPAIMASASKWEQQGILIPGHPQAGRNIFSAWLYSRGHFYLSANLVSLDNESDTMQGLPLPFLVKTSEPKEISALLEPLAQTHSIYENTHLFRLQDDHGDTAQKDASLSLLVFPRLSPGTSLEVTPLPPAQVSIQLMNCMLNAKKLAGKGFPRIARLAREIPALSISFGSLDDLNSLDNHFLPAILHHKLSPSALKSLLQPITARVTACPQKAQPIAPTIPDIRAFPESSPQRPRKRLTIGMATYDDYDGVYFSVMALRLYHPEIMDDTEILVIDNHPDGPCGAPLQQLAGNIPNVRYIPLSAHSGTMVRDYLYRYAAGDFVLCIDSHVLIHEGALKLLLDYFEKHPHSRDLLQGPLVYDDLTTLKTHFEPKWRSGMFGTWAIDPRGENPNNPPFEIQMQGLGLFACTREAWPGFNPRFRGFGGEEGYIHEKFRQQGGKVLCLPFLKWVHRFARPMGVPYPLNWQDRIFNYLVGYHELGLDDTPVREHFSEHLGQESAAREFQSVDAELRSPFFFFDVIYCLTTDPQAKSIRSLTEQLAELGVLRRVRFFQMVESQDDHISQALSHRKIISLAKQQGLENVLVLEDKMRFREKAQFSLHQSVSKLQQTDWEIFILGGRQKMPPSARVAEYSSQARCESLPATHAVAYHQSAFDIILTAIPDSGDAMMRWIDNNSSMSLYLCSIANVCFADPAITSPCMA